MKIAVFHNFMDNIGGAEIVALALTKGLSADLYTTNIDRDKIEKMGYGNILPNIYSIGTVPKNAPFRQQLTFWKFSQLNLKKKYDFYIIAGDWAMSGCVNNKPNLWYAHSPLNELWAFKDYVRNQVIEGWKKPFFDVWVWFNRRLNKKYVNHAQIIICNSKNTQQRVKNIYNRKAGVLNPPVDTAKYFSNPHKGYWLSVNRLTKAKRIELQMHAFAQIPEENLIIVGSYEKGSKPFEKYKKFIGEIKPPNVKIINWATDEELKELYANCIGLITTSIDEDFGMAPVEAMAAGKPVIAPNEGGYKETLVDDVTGKLISDISFEKLIKSIREVGKNPESYKQACLLQAAKFDTQIFINKIQQLLEKPYA